MNKKKIFFYILFLLFTSSLFFTSSASNENIIEKIKILGNERVESIIILNQLTLKEKDKYDLKITNDNIKSLYETGIFKEISVNFENNILTFNVVENPLIVDVLFDGNDKLDDEILLSEISTSKRSIFNKNKINNDVKRILDIYRRGGRFLATVNPKIIKEKNNRVKVVFEIDEGKTAKIRKIYFVGNNNFTSNNLKEKIQSKESKLLRFSSDTTYDPLRIELDKELLRKFYYSKGYPDFEILSAVGEIDKNFKLFDITFLVEEGEKYNFGKIEITNNIKKVDTKKIEKKIKIKTGKVFNGDLLNSTVDSILEELSKEGFVFSNIRPLTHKNEKDKKIDVNFTIDETSRYYVGKIDIIGNTRTYDKIIRRELRLDEGDAFNLTKFNRSIQRIKNLGYFDSVNYKQTKGEDKNKIDITIEVKEKKTGEFQIGIGYSTLDGANINFGIRENNLLGLGQSLGINILYSQYTKDISFNYGKPYLFNRNLYAGFDFYYRRYEDRYSVNYQDDIIGTGVNASYSVTEYLTQKLFYSIESEEITDIDSDYIGIIEYGKKLTSLIGQTLYYDKLDSRYDPTKGYYLSWSSQYAGIGGDKKYIKNTGNISVYFPIITSFLTLKLSSRGGIITSVDNETIDTTDAFFLGGNTFKGFKYGGIGPRTYTSFNSAKNGSSVGGNQYYVYGADLKFPLGLPKEYGIYGNIFYNAGTVTKVDKKYKQLVEDSGSIRSACGLSILWNSPMGPISFDFSKVLKKEDYDETENFAFNFGNTF